MQKWIPRIIALLVGLAGVMSLISALLPGAYDRLLVLREFVPLAVRSTSRILTLLAGFGLIILAQNLLARKHRAWVFSLVLLSLSFFTHLIKGLDFEEASITLITCLLLVRYQFIFSVQSTRLRPVQVIKRIIIILATLTLYAVLGYALLQTQFSTQLRPSAVESDYLNAATGIGRDTLRANSRWSRWFEDSLGIMTTTAGVAILFALFGPLIDQYTPTDEERNMVARLALASPNSISYYATTADKQYFWNNNHDHVIAYRIGGGMAIVLGEPLGIGGGEEVLGEFTEAMEKRGLSVAIYSVRESFALRSKTLGFHPLKIGEEAVIPLDAFELAGADMAEIRHAKSRMVREKMNYLWFNAATIPWSALRNLDILHNNWLRAKNIPPLTFSLENYPFAPVEEISILVIQDKAGELLGALSFFPYQEGKSITLDLMLRGPNAPNGLVEAGIAEAVTHFRNLGIEDLNLGLAPLANTSMQTIFNYFSHFYGFKSLHKFKAKFLPRWESKYLLIKDRISLPKVAFALGAVHLKKATI